MEEMERNKERNMETKVEEFKEKINIEFNEKIKVIFLSLLFPKIWKKHIDIIHTNIHSAFLLKYLIHV